MAGDGELDGEITQRVQVGWIHWQRVSGVLEDLVVGHAMSNHYVGQIIMALEVQGTKKRGMPSNESRRRTGLCGGDSSSTPDPT